VEDQLWDAIRDNDKEAFTMLYKAYYQLLFAEGFRTCGNKDLVKDCIHELFLEIWYNRHKLPPVQHVGAYLKTYLRRKIQREAGKLHVLPLGAGARQQVLADPPWAAVAIRLVRPL